MLKKPLIETNANLRDPVRYRRELAANVSSSTAIETGGTIAAITRTLNGDAKSPAPLPVKSGRNSGR
jgi:hypothetical protein